MTRSRPSFSVTSITLAPDGLADSGRKVRLHGFTSPRATGTTRIRITSAVSYSIGSTGIRPGSNPEGAIGEPSSKGTLCCAAPMPCVANAQDAIRENQAMGRRVAIRMVGHLVRGVSIR